LVVVGGSALLPDGVCALLPDGVCATRTAIDTATTITTIRALDIRSI
jgi:hypothetical protein